MNLNKNDISNTKYIEKKKILKFNNNNISILKNKYFLFKNKSHLIFFNISAVDFCFSFKFGISKVEYYIGFYEKKKLIYPSNLALHKNLHILCNINSKNKNEEFVYNSDSIPNIYSNKYFKCIEFFNINDTLEFGIKIYQKNIRGNDIILTVNIFNGKELNYNNLKCISDSVFDPLIINQEYDNLLKNINDISINETLKLKKLYIKPPICKTKKEFGHYFGWNVKNLYNHYFCFCLGRYCSEKEIEQNETYYFYLHIIDNNKDIYNKTDYLLADFIFIDKSSDDTYPIFQEMEKRNLPVHYVTEDKNIYNKYCYQNEKCLKIIPFSLKSYIRFGDFLENYLTLLLKLKVVISCKENANSKYSELFYKLHYITYIAIGHGVCYFKDWLYHENRTYGIKKNDKILIPPTDKIIKIAKKFGWKDENIIKLNLPRWDKYNYNEKDLNNSEIKNNSIFVMFTWRAQEESRISLDYLHNIIFLLKNNLLNEELKLNNMTLYFTYHRLCFERLFPITKANLQNYKNIKLIMQSSISDILAKTNLVVTDFSSIIFDMIYRRRPFVIYIPDAYDPDIKGLYKAEYYELINSMKNGTIQFKNVYFNINETVNKIIYYIHSKFTLEKSLAQFYNSFHFKKGNNIDKIIEYLKSLK